MKSGLRVVLIVLFLAAAGSTAVQTRQAGGIGTVPDCPASICGLK